MNYANPTEADIQSRNIILIRRDGENQHIQTISRMWEPLTYPLFFPHATLGWGVVGSTDEIKTGEGGYPVQDEGIAGTTQQIMHYCMRILREPRFHIFGRLTNEYLVDMFSWNLEQRLNYIRMNQKHLRQAAAALMGITYL